MTARDYLEMIWSLYPKGRAWVREAGGVLETINTVIAQECVYIENRATGLFTEADPRTTTEMLEDWETDYGLPDTCSPLGATIQERRAAVIFLRNFEGSLALSWYKRLAASLGYDVDVWNWRPFVCGTSACGPDFMLGPEAIRYVFKVDIYGSAVYWFECGVSECGDALVYWVEPDELICRISKLAPGYAKVIFDYKEERI